MNITLMRAHGIKKYTYIFAGLLCIIMICAGCNENKEKLTIITSLKKYSPLMSSVPGLPLAVRFKHGKTPNNVVFHWTTGYGRFLSWDNKAHILGNDIKTQLIQVYWSIDFEEKMNIAHFMINLKAEDIHSGKILAETQIEIEKDREGYFIVK